MQMIETSNSPIISLPLPSSALVIDTRGIDGENVMDRLKIEIEDLAYEMKAQSIHHWRYLTDFLSFWNNEQLKLMTPEQVNSLRTEKVSTNGVHSQTTAVAQTSPASATTQTSLTGKIDRSTSKSYTGAFFYKDEDIAPLAEDRPVEQVEQNIQKMVQEVDRLRNNRHVAVADVEPSLAGSSVKDATVRIIFLTDAGRPDSLATTALYAARIKQYYVKKQHAGQQPMISTAAICLNNSGDATPSLDLKELLWDNGWDHLDALILTEDYRQDAARIAGAVQAYLAELLLYVLMIVPPLPVDDSPIETNGTVQANTNPAQGNASTGEEKKGQSIPLPPYTFVVGLAAIEHSARWGRRLLNYQVVERTIEVLQKGVESERTRAKNVVTIWLNKWRETVKDVIPDKVPGNIEALEAINDAKRPIKPADKIFTLKTFSLNLGKSTLTDVEEYLVSLRQTYNLEQVPQTAQQQEREPTLQDAIDSIPQIQLCLREWETKDPAMRKETPLVNAQFEAQHILSQKDFFTGANGAIPRARMQLEELSKAITNLRSEHQQHPINLSARCDELKKKGTKHIEELGQHIESIPFFSSVLHLKETMTWLTFFFALILSLIATFIGVAWLRHLIDYLNVHGPYMAIPDITPVLNNFLLLSASPLAFIFWLLVLGIVALVAVSLGRRLLRDQKRSNFNVEIIFLLSLLVFTFIGLLVSYSETQLVSDPNSLSIIAWLSFVPTIGVILFIIVLLALIAELIYFIWWYEHLQEERVRIVKELGDEHQKNIDDVARFIADNIVLYLLQHTGLTNEKGGPGEYYQRLNQLYTELKSILDNAQKQQRMARERLRMSLSETQLGTDKAYQGMWLNLGIRKEELDVDKLTEGYNRLTMRLGQEIEELKELAEILLRMMGEETSGEIEQQFRERIPAKGSIEQHNAQVLMTTLVAMAFRLAIHATSISSLSPLLQQYDSVVDNLNYEPVAMKALIESLRKKLRQNMLQPITDGRARMTERETHTMATNAFAAWAQMLWEGKDSDLDRALSSEGVLPKLLEMDDYSPSLVKTLLTLRTSLFSRNARPGQRGTLYLLLPPSAYSHQFIHDLNLSSKHIKGFPDTERLILLYIQHYTGEPLFIPEPQTLQLKAGPGTPDQSAIGQTNGGATNGQSNAGADPLSNTVVSSASPAQATNGNGVVTGAAQVVDTNAVVTGVAPAQVVDSTGDTSGAATPVTGQNTPI